jgi:hypothetical protein
MSNNFLVLILITILLLDFFNLSNIKSNDKSDKSDKPDNSNNNLDNKSDKSDNLDNLDNKLDNLDNKSDNLDNNSNIRAINNVEHANSIIHLEQGDDNIDDINDTNDTNNTNNLEHFTDTENVNNLNTKFGKPYDFKPNEYIIWEFNNSEPWTKIVYRYNKETPYYFYMKVKIPSLNDYENWKNIITNLHFNPTKGELIIPSKDEETALALGNLMVSTFNGDLTLQEIINRDLIAISITKAFKYEVVKNKIREQLIAGLNYKNTKNTKNITHDTSKSEDISSNYFYYNKNDSINSKNLNSFEAYEGSEFSFI